MEVSAKEITGGLVRGKRNYLRLRQRPFSAYVSVFPIGRDLFIGWTIWWELKPLVMSIPRNLPGPIRVGNVMWAATSRTFHSSAGSAARPSPWPSRRVP